MNQSPLSRLSAILKINGTVENWLLGGLLGLLMPVFLLLAGLTIELLVEAQMGVVPAKLTLGKYIAISSSTIGADRSVMQGTVTLIVAMVLVVTLMATISWFLYRSAAAHAVNTSLQIYRGLSSKSHQLAVVQGVSGQRPVLREAIQSHLPLIVDTVLRSYRSLPRHTIQIIACIALSLLIHPLMTILGLTLLGLLYRLYDWFDSRERGGLPVLRERAKLFEDQILELCETGPLLSTIHPGGNHQEALETHLRNYRASAQSRAFHGLWKTPLMTIATGFAVCLFVFILAIQIVDKERSFSLASGLVVLALQLVATVSAIRLIRLRESAWTARNACDAVVRFLDQAIPTVTTENTKKMGRLAEQVSFDHITLRDSAGKKLLEDITVRLRPSQLVSVVSNDPLQARAFGELLLGFGTPASGRMVFDQNLSTDIDHESLQSQCLWISNDGPTIAGTIEDNIRFGSKSLAGLDLGEAIRQAQVYDAIQEMSDGLATMVTPHDGRLQSDYLFRLGIARALVRKPSIVVAEEPKTRVKSQVESESLAALRSLTRQGMLVVVVPQRLATLRDSDLVVVIHDNKITAMGSHNQLLETSELYRHFNYVRFSNLRHISID